MRDLYIEVIGVQRVSAKLPLSKNKIGHGFPYIIGFLKFFNETTTYFILYSH